MAGLINAGVEAMVVDVLMVANFFIAQSPNGIDAMKLQRLVYSAAGWHLAIFRRPLFEGPILAAEWGPLIPRLDERLRDHGDQMLFEPLGATEDESRLPASARDLLDAVWLAYAGFSGVQMAKMTHEDGTPWAEARLAMGLVAQPEINHVTLVDHYERIAKQRRR